MGKQILTTFLPEEFWYGGIVNQGESFPLDAKSQAEFKLSQNMTVNQMQTIFLSTKGRVIAAKEGFDIFFEQGEILIDTNEQVQLLQAKEATLKGAYFLAMQTYFPFSQSEIPQEMYTAPQFNTWIQLLYDQNQADILQYADDILEHGYQPGVLMIDDNWNPYYGNWTFRAEKFSDPKQMVKTLHQKGFKVMLWVCPHVSPDSELYRQLVKEDVFIKGHDGKVAIREWWNGYSAILDMSNPAAVAWIKAQLDNLVENYGIDGFKFDAGDAQFYRDDDVTYGNVSANDQSYLWAKFAQNYAFNELRASVNNGGMCLAQRLADKAHSWEVGGIASLIPHHLIQSLFGYPYNCPDMIGGGEYLNFLSQKHNLDEELFVRHAQISSLMPMMQYSAAPWRFLSQNAQELCLKAADLRAKYQATINALFKQTAKTGLPITAPLEFYFPNEGLANVTQQFMLGDKLMIAPVIYKDAHEIEVVLPTGKWQDDLGNTFEGGQTIKRSVDLTSVPVYELID